MSMLPSQTIITFTGNQKWEIKTLINYFPIPRVEEKPYSPLVLEKEDLHLKDEIFACLKYAKQQITEKTQIIDKIKALLSENKCISDKDPLYRNILHEEIVVGLQKLKAKIYEKDRDSECFNMFIGLFSELRNLKEGNLKEFQNELIAASRLSLMERESLGWIAKKIVKVDNLMLIAEEDNKLTSLLGKLMKNGPFQEFKQVQEFSNPELKQRCKRIIDYFQSECVNICNDYSPFRELIRKLSKNVIRQAQIYAKLNEIPEKARGIFEPLCKEVIKLRENSKEQDSGQKPVHSQRNISLTNSLNYPQKTAQKIKEPVEMDEKVLRELEECKRFCNKTQKQLMKVKWLLEKMSSINKLFKEECIYERIDKQLETCDEEIKQFLRVIYKNLKAFEEVRVKKENQAKKVELEIKQTQKIVNSSMHKDREEIKKYEKNIEELIRKNNKKEEELKNIQKQMLNMKDLFQENKEKIEKYNLQKIQKDRFMSECLSKLQQYKKSLIVYKRQLKEKMQLIEKINAEKRQKQFEKRQAEIRLSESIVVQASNSQNQSKLHEQNLMLKAQISSLELIIAQNNKYNEEIQRNQLKKTVFLEDKQQKSQIDQSILPLHDIAEFKSRILELETKISQKDEAIKQLKGQISVGKEEINNLKKKQMELCSEYDNLKQENVLLKNHKVYEDIQMKKILKDERQQKQTLQKALTDQKQKSVSVFKDYVQLQKNYKQMQGNFKQLQRNTKQNQLDVSISRQKQKSINKSQVVTNVVVDNDKHGQQNYKVLERNHNQLKKYNEMLKKEYERVKNQNSILTGKHKIGDQANSQDIDIKLINNYKNLNNNYEQVKQKCMDLTEENELLRRDKKDLEQRLLKGPNDKENQRLFERFRCESKQSKKESETLEKRLQEMSERYAKLKEKSQSEIKLKEQEMAFQRMEMLKLQHKLQIADNNHSLPNRQSVEALHKQIQDLRTEIVQLRQIMLKKDRQLLQLKARIHQYQK